MPKDYDLLFSIKTTNKRIVSNQAEHYNHYEATPYPIIHAFFNAYTLDSTDSFVDFGCGKGRLLYYVHYRFHSSVTGIEMNEYLYKKTIKNKQNYLNKVKEIKNPIKVKCSLAENYEIKSSENIFYFFNPFSLKIFKRVIRNILLSVQHHPRKIDIILYYPDTMYTNFLNKEGSFELVKKVKVPRLYEINNNECFLIYRVKN